MFKEGAAYSQSDDPLERRDGEWLTEALGIDGAVLERIPHAGGSDQREARAMSIALWPATLGYWLEEMLTPIVPAADIAATRSFAAASCRDGGRCRPCASGSSRTASCWRRPSPATARRSVMTRSSSSA